MSYTTIPLQQRTPPASPASSRWLSDPTQPFSLLPSELLFHILSYVDVADLLRCSALSKNWSELCYDSAHWRDRCKHMYGCRLMLFDELIQSSKWNWKQHFLEVHRCFKMHTNAHQVDEDVGISNFLSEHLVYRYSEFIYGLLSLEKCSLHDSVYMTSGWAGDDVSQRQTWIAKCKSAQRFDSEVNVTKELLECLSELQHAYCTPSWIHIDRVPQWCSKHGRHEELNLSSEDLKSIERFPIKHACTGLLDLEMNIKWEAVAPEWRTVRDPWRAGLKQLQLWCGEKMLDDPMHIDQEEKQALPHGPPYLNERVHWSEFTYVNPLATVKWPMWQWMWGNERHLAERLARRNTEVKEREAAKVLIASVLEVEQQMKWHSMSPLWRLQRRDWVQSSKQLLLGLAKEFEDLKEKVIPLETVVDQKIQEARGVGELSGLVTDWGEQEEVESVELMRVWMKRLRWHILESAKHCAKQMLELDSVVYRQVLVQPVPDSSDPAAALLSPVLVSEQERGEWRDRMRKIMDAQVLVEGLEVGKVVKELTELLITYAGWLHGKAVVKRLKDRGSAWESSLAELGFLWAVSENGEVLHKGWWEA